MRCLLLLLALAPGAAAAQPTPGPVLPDFGPVYAIDAPDLATPAGPLRAVFDVTQTAEAPDARNRYIESLARFLNMHARAGVPADQMALALVVHGGAAKDLLSDAAYASRYGVSNPNTALLQGLRDAGVRIVLCGQSASARGFGRDELAAPVEVALSAMTARYVFQSAGYELLGF